MRIWIAVAVVVGACGKGAGGGGKAGDDPKVKDARMEVSKLAFESFAQWNMDHQGKACPGSLDDLAPYLDHGDLHDPWGNPLAMKCGPDAPAQAKGFGVVSAGPDGKMGTDDDIASWQLERP